MAGKTLNLMILVLLPIALSMQMNGASAPHKMALSVVNSNADAVAEMGKVFERSAEAHHKSMEDISKSMTQPQALEVLRKNSIVNTSALDRVTSLLTGSQNLRKQLNAGDGFGGLDGARRLLNDMIHEVEVKYDAEIAKCTDYYSKQCALMEVARGQISAANYVAATARALILDSQASINHCELSIPESKQELKDHNRKCKGQKDKMNHNLKILMDDVAIMTMILEMSDCDTKFLQMQKLTLLKCKDRCTSKDYVTFNHKSLQQHVNELKSPGMQELMTETFADLFEDSEPDESVQLVQVEGSEYMEAVVNMTHEREQVFKFSQDSVPKTHKLLVMKATQPAEAIPAPVEATPAPVTPAPKKTKFNNPPVPRTKVPGNPCTDPNRGAPSAADKRAAKCTLKKSPRCYKLQGRFLQIQAGIVDSRDALLDLISQTEQSCDDTKKSLETSIANDGSLLSSSQTKLATATEKESSSGEFARQISKENNQYDADLKKQMKTCSGNYIDFETDLCALRKIRGDLFKKMQAGHSGFFQDCVVTPWSPEACSKKCAGGNQKLTRSIMSHPNGGSKCLPLSAQKRCNRGPCPVNCVLAQWSGWSRCSSKCGGGLSQRVRDVKVPMQYAGKQCGQTSQAKQCNVDACEKDCVLHPWTRWTSCSKNCDGGSKKRERIIKEAAEGAGACAGKWEPSRLQYLPCSLHRCTVPDHTKVMKCNQTMDIVLVLDGTPKSGQAGFNAEMKAADLFIDAFQGDGITAKPSFSVVHYTGPRTWSGVSKCTGKNSVEVDMEKTCKVTLAQHFTDDVAAVKSTVSALKYQPGSKLLSLALMVTQFEFALGTKTSRTVVVVFMDGQPLSYRKTQLASRAIRKKARLLWVVMAKLSPLKSIKKWASRRWQENLVQVESLKQLASAETGTHIVANICPRSFPKLEAAPLQ